MVENPKRDQENDGIKKGIIEETGNNYKKKKKEKETQGEIQDKTRK